MAPQGFYTYQTIRKLGHGSFGEVQLARAEETGAVVALKRIYIRDATDGLPENVVREFKAMYSVCHPNVLRLQDVFVKGHSIVLALEYCTTDLAKVLRHMDGRMPEKYVKCLMQQVLRGLHACHTAAILHRDLKPSNLLLTQDGWVKLADFGLARPHDGSQRPQYTHTVATRWYRAPELLYGARSYGPAVDIWAVGAVFAEMLGMGPLIPGDNDIDQLTKTIQVLGSMEEDWPEVVQLPDYGKVIFGQCERTPWPKLLPGASQAALQLLEKLLRYNPDARVAADAALLDPYFHTSPEAAQPHELAQFVASAMAGADAALD